MLENPVTDITIAMEVNYFQLNRAEYFVPVAVKIPGSELALARRGGAQRTRDRLHRRGEGRLRLHDAEHPRQAGHQAERRHRRPARQAADSDTKPASRCCRARYVIKFLARDAETGRIGTYHAVVHDPEPEQGRASACRSARWC